jgi:hypothetical protein
VEFLPVEECNRGIGGAEVDAEAVGHVRPPLK